MLVTIIKSKEGDRPTYIDRLQTVSKWSDCEASYHQTDGANPADFGPRATHTHREPTVTHTNAHTQTVVHAHTHARCRGSLESEQRGVVRE